MSKIAAIISAILMLIGGGEKEFFYTVVEIDGDRVVIKAVNQAEGRGLVLKLPDNLLIPVSGSKGELKLSALWRFGEVEGEAEKMVEESLERYLGISIEKVWLKAGRMSLERWLFERGFGQLRPDQVKTLNLAEEWRERETLANSDEVVRTDQTRLRDWLAAEWQNETLRAEGAKVILVNVGGGKREPMVIERLINSAGIRVLAMEMGEEGRDGCSLVTADQGWKLTLKWLKNRLGCRQEKLAGARPGVIEVRLK